MKLLIGVAKNWAILQKTHLEACYTPKFHYKRQSDAILIKFWHWNHIKITFIFQVLLVTCPKFDYSAGRDFNFGQNWSIFIFLGLFGQCLSVPNWATWYLKICKIACSLMVHPVFLPRFSIKSSKYTDFSSCFDGLVVRSLDFGSEGFRFESCLQQK